MNVSVEAELGRLVTGESGEAQAGMGKPEDYYTDPAEAEAFCRETGVDALAIAFGTAHGFYKAEPKLDFNVIKNVRASTGLPLVMHGGSGISPEEYKEVIRRGIGKINYYSYMSYAGYAEAKKTVESKEADFFHNLALNAQNAMKENALATLKVFSNME